MSDKVQITDVANDLYRNGQESEVKSKASALNLAYADLRHTSIPNDVLSFLSREEVIQYRAVPIKSEAKKIYLGLVDPEKDTSLLAEGLKRDYKVKEIIPVMISEQSYLDWLPKYSGLNKHDPFEIEEEAIDLSKTENIVTFDELADRLQTAPIQDLLKMILVVGFGAKASDIHIEPRDDWARIRFRLDGTLHEIATLDKDRYKYVLSQIELHSNLKLNANFPQNGRFVIHQTDKDLNVRIETMPTIHGDDIVMRLFNTEASLLKIDDLGYSDYHLPKLKSALQRPHGMLLVVGPTGAGKTSTIYAVLNELNTPEVKIITLEDPVELEMSGLTQSQINEGETFADRLKAVLREDPDIIMVGEIREPATAETALQAALTGHLMISTLHANDAVTSITRLVGMIGEPELVTASTNLIIAQRLVRKVCPDCKTEYQPNSFEMHEFENIIADLPTQLKPTGEYKFYKGAGCQSCHQIGYKGRIGIFELLEIDMNLQKLIVEGAPIFQIQEAAKTSGMITMEQDGVLKALEGSTTLDEVLKSVRE